MFCWNCGKEIGDLNICPQCGVSQGPMPTGRSNHKKKESMILVAVCAVIGGILLLVMLVLGTFLLLNRDRTEPETQIHVPAATVMPAPTDAPKQEITLPADVTIPTDAPQSTDAPAATDAPQVTEPPEPTVQKLEENDLYNCILPDLATFLGTKYTQDVWGYTHYVTCLIDKDEEDAIMEAFFDLLLEPRYLLKERDTWSGTEEGREAHYYSFEYTGKNKDVDWIQTKSGRKYYVRVMTIDYSSTQTAIVFSSHPEFIMRDPGVTWQDRKATSVTVQQPATVTTPVTVSDRELPSFLKTKGDDFYVRQYDPSDSAKHYTGIIFGADIDEADAAEKYVDMLVKDYGYKVIHTGGKKLKNSQNYSWHLAHPDKDVGRKHPLESDGGDADVTIKIIQYWDAGDCTMEMAYVTDLTFPDAAGLKKNEDDNDSTCWYCHKKGRNNPCPTCGGTNWINCGSCSNGRCRVCSS